MRLSTVSILLVLVLLSIIQPLQAVSQDGRGFESIVRVPVPAVSSDVGGAKLIDIVVKVRYPGSGNVNVTGGGEVDDTTRYSMITAAMIAALFAGYDPWSLDVEVEIRSLGPVAGTSGSLGVALATYYALLYKANGDLEDLGVSVTGAISPDTLAVSVGEVPKKCQAANREGLRLVIPLSNLKDVEGSSCNFIAVSGLIDGLAILGVPRIEGSLRVETPPEFAKAMKGVAKDLRAEAERVLAEVGKRMDPQQYSSLREAIKGKLRESVEAEAKSFYAAASLAFAALVDAYTAYYTLYLSSEGNQVDAVVSEIESELQALREKLDSMSQNGSLFYVETLSVAYTRLASAEASLEEVKRLSRVVPPQEVARSLAYAKARVYSIEAWIDVAEELRDVGRSLTVNEVETVVARFRGFVKLVVEYAKALADYLIEVVNTPQRPEIESYKASIDLVMEQAEDMWSNGHYVAALGFYREAYSRSLLLIFTGSVERLGRDVIRVYMEELRSAYTVMAARTYAAGYISGLAELYMQYADVLSEDEATMGQAVEIMEEAVASITPWLLATQATRQYIPEAPQTTPGGELEGGLEGGVERVRATLEPIVTVAMTAAAAAFMLGFYTASRSYARSQRFWA